VATVVGVVADGMSETEIAAAHRVGGRNLDLAVYSMVAEDWVRP
jgi:hypothetical protein